jgi:hypothetical protein
LDEETHVLESAVLGIFHFTSANKNPIGQGLITYGKGRVVSWLNTLLDSGRVQSYVCSLFFNLKYYKNGVTNFNGAFFVVKKRVEHELSFDFGVPGALFLLNIY